MATQHWPPLLARVFPQQVHTQAQRRDILKCFCTIFGSASVMLQIRRAISATGRGNLGSHSVCARFVPGLTHGISESGQMKYWERKEVPSVFALFLDAFVWFAVRYSLSIVIVAAFALCLLVFSYSKSSKWILWNLWCSLCTLNSYHLICDTHTGCFVMHTELYTLLLRGEMILRVGTKNQIQPENHKIFLHKTH